MPLLHERTFGVRHYECNAHGQVSYANHLRYMQQAAMEASAAAGYDNARYDEIGRQWWIRETDVTFVRPLTYGDTLIVKTWVADFHRVRSRRRYEMRRADTGEIVCEAQTDWVFLDTATQRPIVIPPEMIAAFYPEGLPEQKRTPDAFPDAPPPTDCFSTRRRPEFRDLDAAQHVNNAVYLDYFEDAARQEAARWLPDGVDLALRRCRIEYKVPARLGDDLDVLAWVSAASPTALTRQFTLLRVADAVQIGRAYSEWAWIEAATGRPVQAAADVVAYLGGTS